MKTKKQLIKIKEKRKKDLSLLFEYASRCYFIIETGAGKSTKYLANAAKKNNAKMITIEINEKYCNLVSNVEYRCGWSISYNDLYDYYNKLNHSIKKIINKLSNKKYLDAKVARLGEEFMEGEKDIIKKVLKRYENIELDFFFCDSGELCGIPEWNIVKNKIKIGGYFAIHDIYYPKSIKGFKVCKKIENSKNWEIKEKTDSKQGLLIAQKIR